MNITATEKSAIKTAYSHLYWNYQKCKRSRRGETMRAIQCDLYKRRLRGLQRLIIKLNIKCEFKEL